MANYLDDQRETELFVRGSLDRLLPDASIARVIWEGLSRLDFSAFDALYTNEEGGRAAFDPRGLCGAWILALLRGVSSSRCVAELCENDVEFRWMTGDAGPLKSTLADFRKRHKDRLAGLGAQVLTVLGQEGLLPGERLGVDGTVVRAASSRHASRKRKGLDRQVARVRELLDQRLSAEDEEDASPETAALAKRQAKIAQALERMDELGLTRPEDRLTTTEPDARLLKQKDNSFAPGHNAQMVVDLDTGAIVHLERVAAGNDAGQLENQTAKACAALREVHGPEHTVNAVAADSAYHDTRQLVSLEEQGIACYVPQDRNTRRAAPGISEAFRADAFNHDDASDTMTCPQGCTLRWRKLNNDKTSAVYEAAKRDCASCPSKPQCCPNTKGGRSVNRSLHKELLDTIADRVATSRGQWMKQARSVGCEGAFARLKRLLHWWRCPMWGKEGMQADLTWRQLTHNVMLMTQSWRPLAVNTAEHG